MYRRPVRLDVNPTAVTAVAVPTRQLAVVNMVWMEEADTINVIHRLHPDLDRLRAAPSGTTNEWIQQRRDF